MNINMKDALIREILVWCLLVAGMFIITGRTYASIPAPDSSLETMGQQERELEHMRELELERIDDHYREINNRYEDYLKSQNFTSDHSALERLNFELKNAFSNLKESSEDTYEEAKIETLILIESMRKNLSLL